MINNSHFHNLPTDVHVLIASRLENPRDWKAYRSLCKKTYEVSKRDVFQNRNTPFLNSRRTAEALENLLTNNYVKIEDKARFIHYGYPAAKFSNLTFTIFSKKTLRIANDERTLEKEIQFSKAIKTYNVF